MQKLTKRQEEKLKALEATNWHVTNAAARLGISKQAMSKAVAVLKKKGVIKSRKNAMVDKNDPPMVDKSAKSPKNDTFISTGNSTDPWRLHNLHFVWKPFYISDSYKSHIGKVVTRGPWRVRFHAKSLQFQSLPGRSFYSSSPLECSVIVQREILQVGGWVEDHFGVSLLKENSANLEQVAGHLAKEDEDEARAISEDFLQVRGSDGKVWLQIDRSVGPLEWEAVHPKGHVEDAQILESFINDLRDYYLATGEVPYTSQLVTALDSAAKSIMGNTVAVSTLIKLLTPRSPQSSGGSDVGLGSADYIG